MLKQETLDAAGGGNDWARVCDTCRSAACTVYCRADSAYLCAGCDAQVHAANRVASRHERVWVCEACESAPAAFLCKADAASLCTTCDAEIHSANPLARRHQRVPILPISGCLYAPLATDQGGPKMASATETEDGFMSTNGDETIAEDEDEAASWLLLNPGKTSTNQNKGFLITREDDKYLDLVDYNSSVDIQITEQYNQQNEYGVPVKSYGGDSVVPVQWEEAKYHFQQQQQQQHQSFQYGLDYDSSKAAYSYDGSISHTVRYPFPQWM
ncbi:zinc finger protein CONSTANS-like isoform X2 [Hibiscus syriacus]|uniref:zinc finger protein CONSTANS-like isoform X2 n=1 Tax=Hibiscus syriacus TaxID=106335 RepID=UPI0019250B63|nr:zinc finger protein CONSTANS-like isoform X2 [Hibiscus syriacus]